MKIEQIHQVAVFARELSEAIDFYTNVLGATFVARFDPPGIAFFDFKGTRIMLEASAPKASVYFRVDDIHAACEELKSHGVTLIAEPQVIFRDDDGLFGAKGEEEWMAFFSDPSDNTLALASRQVKKGES